MPEPRPAPSRQSCICNLDARVRQIQIGNVIVGIVGLDDALQQLSLLGRSPGPEAAEELLAMIKTRNWVARGSEEDYKEALLREYTWYWEAKAGTSASGEKAVNQ